MGPSLSCLLLFLLLVFSSWLPPLRAQLQLNSSSTASARSLDALLQDYAFRAFVRPRTGIPFDGSVPSNLTGINISAIRLRSGSMRIRGVPRYKEFEIPKGVIEQPYVERLVLVYQNLGSKLSSVYYPLDGYTYVSSVLGLLAYSAANLSATNLAELNIEASSDPMLIHYSDVVPSGRVPKCVWFGLNGSANFTSVVSDNTCSTTAQGHFALVVEGTIPPPPTGSVVPTNPGHKKHHKTSSKVWIIVGSVLGGLLLLVLFAILFAWLKKYEHKKKMQRMEKAADVGEALRVTSVGSAKAPSAVRTRTQPSLETEYVP